MDSCVYKCRALQIPWQIFFHFLILILAHRTRETVSLCIPTHISARIFLDLIFFVPGVPFGGCCFCQRFRAAFVHSLLFLFPCNHYNPLRRWMCSREAQEYWASRELINICGMWDYAEDRGIHRRVYCIYWWLIVTHRNGIPGDVKIPQTNRRIVTISWRSRLITVWNYNKYLLRAYNYSTFAAKRSISKNRAAMDALVQSTCQACRQPHIIANVSERSTFELSAVDSFALFFAAVFFYFVACICLQIESNRKISIRNCHLSQVTISLTTIIHAKRHTIYPYRCDAIFFFASPSLCLFAACVVVFDENKLQSI